MPPALPVGWEAQPAIVAAFTISGFFDSTAFVASFAAWAKLPAGRVSITTASAACAVVPTQTSFQVHSDTCANMLTAAEQLLSSAAGLSGTNLDVANSACASGASSAGTAFASLANLLCCTSLGGVVAALGAVASCQEYADEMQSLCNGITACGAAHGSRRLQEGTTATAGTSIALTVLTQGMSPAQVTSLETKLSAILADSGAFFDAFGLILLSLEEVPNQETIAAPLLPDSVLAQSVGGGGGGGSGWIGGVFGAFGSLAGIAGFYCWYHDRPKRMNEAGMMQMMDEPANGRGRTPTLAKHAVGGGHGAGSEMVAYDGHGQLSSAI
jgi:hypothetical protein